MTKFELCKEIVDVVDNMNYIGETDKDKQAEAVKTLISTLKPIDRKVFAKWGQPHQQTTIDECWD